MSFVVCPTVAKAYLAAMVRLTAAARHQVAESRGLATVPGWEGGPCGPNALYWYCIGILLYRGYMGIMENEMEATKRFLQATLVTPSKK